MVVLTDNSHVSLTKSSVTETGAGQYTLKMNLFLSISQVQLRPDTVVLTDDGHVSLTKSSVTETRPRWY